MYGELDRLGDAWKVFNTMTMKDVVSWSSITASCVDNGEIGEGLKIFQTSGVLACSGTLRRCKRMIFLNISAKFLGTRSDFLIDQPKKYTLSALFVDVYLFTCSKLPDPSKKYKAEYSYLEETCTPKVAYVYISINEDDDYPEEEPISNEGSKTDDNVADSEDSLESNYNPNSCEVVQEDATPGSSSETVHAATVDGEYCNEVKSGDDSDEEQLSNAASFNWNNDFMLHDSSNDNTTDALSKPLSRSKHD
ncbi:hypothetical protein JRO89_XS07G0134300 [Xanthoceras sorbifolium]|uniref:Pentatricopeptide repeat-containing protein n=1 Tax=Xanthoceras sorbifolium TaxID=99658 RepID=A0ABQ8HTW5_9ROSI|nr:hypothetical protein JRO89_XS07G0134300 [Xanthoceras sorbifolium]